jgi:hypothetical protein
MPRKKTTRELLEDLHGLFTKECLAMLSDKEHPPSAAMLEQIRRFLKDQGIVADKVRKASGGSYSLPSSAIDPMGLPFGGPEEDEDAPTSH